jgi:hypothetical protein
LAKEDFQIDLKKLLRTLKRRGPRAVLFAVASTLALGIADQFTGRIIPKLTSAIDNYLYPPKFVLRFSDPVTIQDRGISLREVEADPGSALMAAYQVESPKLVAVQAPPGSYFIVLRRDSRGAQEELTAHLFVKEKGEALDVDTSNHNWASSTELNQGGDSEGGVSPSTADFLSGTRWTTTTEDFVMVQSVADHTLRSALAIALMEVGTYEFGSSDDRRRISEYWSAVPTWTSPIENQPWGGTFLSWVMSRANIPSPGSASFRDWRKWGYSVPSNQVTPGMIAIFSKPGLPEARSGLLVGIILKLREKCTEIVAGNIADRVVITCVEEAPLDVRWVSRSE